MHSMMWEKHVKPVTQARDINREVVCLDSKWSLNRIIANKYVISLEKHILIIISTTCPIQYQLWA